MIGDFSKSLKELLGGQARVTFLVPDRYSFRNIAADTINCFLFDISEDREYRTIQPSSSPGVDGSTKISRQPTPVRLSYCITAHVKGGNSDDEDANLREQELLGKALVTLLRDGTFPDDALVGPLNDDVKARKLRIPTSVATYAHQERHADFWNAVGGSLRPWIAYSAIIPLVKPDKPEPQPMATTVEVGTRLVRGEDDPLSAGSSAYVIGGVVRGAHRNEEPSFVIPDAWVRVEETGETVTTDTEGRFRLSCFTGKTTEREYTLQVRVPGFRPGQRKILIPEPSGHYDVSLELQ